MYLKMFGFREKPFHITPNPRFIFLSKIHREAFAHLLYGIQQRIGFLSLTGEVGTGKTTILRTLLGQLEEADYRVALIFNPSLNALELLQAIHREFAIEFDPVHSNLVQLHDSLNRFLLREREAGKTLVLVIDEAQNLDPAVLEQLRLLSNLETETEKLIQIVLVGQPELVQILDRKDLRQLRQRIAVSYQLLEMDADDTARYVRHRLKVAGWQSGPLFSEKALQLIYKFSGGVPRLINILCDRALLVAYGRDSMTISPADVRSAYMELEPQDRPRQRNPLPILAAGALLLFLVAFWGGRLYLPEPPPVTETAVAIEKQPIERQDLPTQENPIDKPAIDTSRSEQLKAAVASIPVEACFQHAMVALTRIWQKELPGGEANPGTIATVRAYLNDLGFTTIDLQTQLPDLAEMNPPAMLVVVLPGIPGNRYFTLTAVTKSAVRIEPALTESGWLSKEELQQIWFGQTLVPYINFQNIQLISQPGQGGVQVQALQELLLKSGSTTSPPSGIFDPATIEAVTGFQLEHGLIPDGRVGVQTLYWLYKEAGLGMPGLDSEGEI